uniref:Uncharacterized protein n=1 Tax=Arundo donax TaxID=35708 RepID=A0A0A9HF67_ARUDO
MHSSSPNSSSATDPMDRCLL